ncbi:MAG: hypothetical protein ACRD2W_24710 [Acidimicrobiales bacterium]
MDAREVGGLWLLREMWGFPAGVPEDERLEYLKLIMACARGDGVLSSREPDWVIGYGAACGAHQSTVDALAGYDGDEDVVAIVDRNLPAAAGWARVAVFDAIRACAADREYNGEEKQAVRRIAARLDRGEDVVAALEAVHEAEQDVKARRVGLIFGDAVPYQDRA